MDLTCRFGLEKGMFIDFSQYGFSGLPSESEFPKCSRPKRILICGKCFWNRAERLELACAERWACYLFPELLFVWHFFLVSPLHQHCPEYLSPNPGGAVSCAAQIALSRGTFVLRVSQAVVTNSGKPCLLFQWDSSSNLAQNSAAAAALCSLPFFPTPLMYLGILKALLLCWVPLGFSTDPFVWFSIGERSVVCALLSAAVIILSSHPKSLSWALPSLVSNSH